jgi:hypothetical protein
MVTLSPSGGSVNVFPPTLKSAAATSGRNIRLTWSYLPHITKFKFERTNLTFSTTTAFEITVPASSGDRTFDDDDGGAGLDPQTSYRYRVAAYHPEFPGYGPWSDQKTATTFDAPFETVFSAPLDLDSDGRQGYCLVQQISGFAKGGRQLQLTLRASSTSPAYVDRLFISKPAPAGHPYDSAGDLIEVHPKLEVKANRSLTLAIRYTLDPQQPLLIAVDFSASPPAAPSGIKYFEVRRLPVFDMMFRGLGLSPRLSGRLAGVLRLLGLSRLLGRGHPGFGPLGRAYWKLGSEAALMDRSPNYTAEDRIYFLEKVEVR